MFQTFDEDLKCNVEEIRTLLTHDEVTSEIAC